MKMNPKNPEHAFFRWALMSAFAVGMGTAGWSQAATPSSTSSAATQSSDEEAIELSPFEVDASKNVGYYAENTLAGSRLNTNIGDLAASITVVTKQQMEDTASVDINDVFRYEVNTEGSSTYTPSIQSLRNDGVVDTNAGFTQGGSGAPQTNATANRVRGIGVPSTAINYYPSISQIPFDAYNVQSIEINRGPNSLLFGMGSPAGIVNQSTAQAALNRDSGSISVRYDDRGSRRGSISFNKGLIDDKLAFFGALMYENRQFERKPSYDVTRRQYGTLTFRPTQKTTLRASIENYNNDNRRANSLTPRDFVTEWRLAGQPVYDPETLMVTKMATGETVEPFIMNAGSPYLDQVRTYIMDRPDYNPALWNGAQTAYNGVNIYGEGAITNPASVLYVPGISFVNNARPTMQIAGGELVNWMLPVPGRYRTQYGTATNPAANADLYPTEAAIFADPTAAFAYNQRWGASNAWTQTGSNIGSYRYPGVTDKSIYDWSKVNILQMNFGREENRNYNIELEQEILPNLHFSAGWFRQDFESVSNYSVSQLNVATLFVDTNPNLPDGSANPYFGQPYVEDFDPDQFVNGELHDHYRAMVAFTPDFTDNDGWSRWLGRHQLIGLASRQETTRTFIRKRLFFTSGDEVANGTIRWLKNPNNNADGSPTGWNYENISARRTYYLADAGNEPFGAVTRSSGTWNFERFTGDIQTYNFDSNQWEAVTMTQEFIDHSATTGRSERRLDSLSAGITSYLWNDRLVTTVGVRRDDYQARDTTTGAILDEDGNQFAPGMTNQEKWVDGHFQTETVFNRWNRWDKLTGNTSTMGAVFKPFKNWSSIDQRANEGSFWWQFVRDLGFSYNKSDNFNPPPSAQVDAFGTPLLKPTGEGKDWGFQFSAFDNKMFARVTWFKATNENERTNPGTSISRLTGNVDTTLFRNWARTITLINMGRDPRLEGFDANLTPSEEDAVRAAAADIWGQPYTYYDDIGSISATRTAEAEGVEVQITFNPVRNWTMKLTGGKQNTVYSNVLKEFDAWYAHRSPAWDSARASDFLLPEYQDLATYTTSGGRAVDLTTFWDSYGYRPEITLDDAFGNYNAQLYYDINVTPQYSIARDLERQTTPGQRKYRAAILTTYAFESGPLEGFSIGGSQRWEDKAVIGYFGKSSDANADPSYIDISDVTRPIYDSDNWYTDLWINHSRRIMDEKVRMKLQLNVVNVFEGGELKTVAVNYDGSASAFRIIDPRQFIFTASFDF
ncbi:MAG TPA: TonB-dependent receptor plug domain-containing protein [Opitutaceae bacterium]